MEDRSNGKEKEVDTSANDHEEDEDEWFEALTWAEGCPPSPEKKPNPRDDAYRKDRRETEDLRTWSKWRPVESIIHLWTENRFSLSAYQRTRYRWNEQMQSDLITTIMNYPLLTTPILVNQRLGEKGRVVREDVVDGRHRIETLYRYYTGTFPWKVGDRRLFYKDLEQWRQRVFLEFEFNFRMLTDWPEPAVRRYYLLVNNAQPITPGDKFKALDCPLLDYVRKRTALLDRLGAAFVAAGVLHEDAIDNVSHVFGIVARMCGVVLLTLGVVSNSRLLETALRRRTELTADDAERLVSVLEAVAQVLERLAFLSAPLGKRMSLCEVYSICFHLDGLMLLEESHACVERYADFYWQGFLRPRLTAVQDDTRAGNKQKKSNDAPVGRKKKNGALAGNKKEKKKNDTPAGNKNNKNDTRTRAPNASVRRYYATFAQAPNTSKALNVRQEVLVAAWSAYSRKRRCRRIQKSSSNRAGPDGEDSLIDRSDNEGPDGLRVSGMEATIDGREATTDDREATTDDRDDDWFVLRRHGPKDVGGRDPLLDAAPTGDPNPDDEEAGVDDANGPAGVYATQDLAHVHDAQVAKERDRKRKRRPSVRTMPLPAQPTRVRRAPPRAAVAKRRRVGGRRMAARASDTESESVEE